MSNASQQALAASIFSHIKQFPAFLKAQHIAGYLPAEGEVDATAIIQLAWSLNKAIYLPIMPSNKKEGLVFGLYTTKTKLLNRPFGLLEPAALAPDIIPPQALDLVLTPLVAFDYQGNRLGRGGGFYDKTFSFLANQQDTRTPILLGLAYDFQRDEQLITQAWDVPLSYVVTESGLIQCQSQNI